MDSTSPPLSPDSVKVKRIDFGASAGRSIFSMRASAFSRLSAAMMFRSRFH